MTTLPPVKRRYVDTSFGQVHYYMSGEQGPLLFLFHETALSGNQYEKVLPLLGVKCRAIAIDTPGYGMSDPPAAPCDMQSLSARLFAAIQEFDDGPVILAGAHTGSSFALELATTSLRDRATHVILSGLALLTPAEIEDFRNIITVPEVDQDGRFLVVEWEKRRDRWGDRAKLEDILWGTVEQLKVYKRFHWAFEAVFTHDAQAALKNLSAPTLFLIGENDSLLKSDERACALVDNAKLDVLPGIEGRLAYFHPQLYAQKVLEFTGLS